MAEWQKQRIGAQGREGEGRFDLGTRTWQNRLDSHESLGTSNSTGAESRQPTHIWQENVELSDVNGIQSFSKFLQA